MATPRTQVPPEPAQPPQKSKAVRPADNEKPAESAASRMQQALKPPIEPLPKPNERELVKGNEAGLVPVKFSDPTKVKDIASLVAAMKESVSGGRDVGEAVEVVKAMVADKKCYRVLTITGNATPFTEWIAELIDRDIIHCVVTNGSVATHSFSKERGRPMFKIEDPEAVDDNALYAMGLNRIYDIAEMEESLNEGFEVLQKIIDPLEEDAIITSADLTRMIGEYLNEHHPKENGLLHAAARANIPVIIPAFVDCELGLDFYTINKLREKDGKPAVMYDAFGDWEKYAELIKERKESCGIITLGGGVPRNYAQQVGPSFDILTAFGLEDKNLIMRFKYGVRICNANLNEGSLSSCTYNEGRSWGKFWPTKKEAEGAKNKHDFIGMTAEVVADYSIVFPLLVAAALESAD